MARSKKTAPRKKARGRRWGAWVFALLALVVCAAVLAMHISASVVHVQYAQVYLQDLPAAFASTLSGLSKSCDAISSAINTDMSAYVSNFSILIYIFT